MTNEFMKLEAEGEEGVKEGEEGVVVEGRGGFSEVF
jgi:hypothetical protein